MTSVNSKTEGIVETPKRINLKGAKLFPTGLVILAATGLWFMAPPTGLTLQAWHLMIIFLSTIITIILNPLPIGAIAVIAATSCVTTGTLTLTQVLSSFSSSVAWLIVLAFFLALGFKETGLGTRVAYFFVSILGRSTLGLSYGMVLTELLLAPLIPSMTARGGGIIYPIISALAQEQGSHPKDGTERKLGAFLIKVCFQTNMVTSAMFLTAMVGNPLIAKLAENVGVKIDWMTWAIAASVPGLVNLILIPLVLYKLYPPHLKESPQAREIAKKKLQELGPLKPKELLMLVTFAGVLFLWMVGGKLGIEATTAAFIGFSILLFCGVLEWKKCIQEQNAWETLMWFAPLLMMATFLTDFGMMSWFANHVSGWVKAFSWPVTFALITLVYFYSHYGFASVTARVTAFYSPFLLVLISAGAPPMVSALSLAVFASLAGPLTHFGTGSAPIYFGAGYVTVSDWWRYGFIISVMNIAIWLGVGGLWWKVLGYW